MRIIVLRDAEIDIQDSIKWYNDKKRGLGHRFFQIIDHSFDFIAANPDLYPIVFSKVRKKVINGFPYAIYFEYDKDIDQIAIVAVLHFKRSSDVLMQRINTSQ
jgi:toxin ParE1/3/4